MTKLKKPGAKGDSPPIFSHEFVIKNHGDILSCICMVVFVMLMFQSTSSIGSQFIFFHYNETQEPENDTVVAPTRRIQDKIIHTLYRHGPKDTINVLFYSILWIIIHAAIHEYTWERTARKLRLSKTKHYKYYDSGFLVMFYFVSLLWGWNFIIREGYLTNWSLLWEAFPHELMEFAMKFYMLTQMAFWLHCYPELYFMKAKKEHMLSKMFHYTSILVLIAGAYVGRLQRLALVLLTLHYMVEMSFHLSRILHYHQKEYIASLGFSMWHGLSVVCKVITVVLAVITLQFKLRKIEYDDSADVPFYDSALYRTCGMAVLLLLEAFMGWNFVSYLLSRREDATGATEAKVKQPTKKNKEAKNSEKKKN